MLTWVLGKSVHNSECTEKHALVLIADSVGVVSIPTTGPFSLNFAHERKTVVLTVRLMQPKTRLNCTTLSHLGTHFLVSIIRQSTMESCATTGSTEMGSTVGGTMVVRATVKTEERETFSTEAYTTSKVENCTAGNAYMVDRGSVKAEERAMVNAHALTTVMAKDRSTGNANNMVDCVTVKAEEWAKVSADARATVKAEGRPAVNANMVDRAAAKAQQRATSSPEAHITVKAEDRVAVDADMVDCEAPAEIEECAIFSAEAYVAVKAEDHSAGHTAAHLAPSGALVHELDVTRGDGRNAAQGVIGIHPGQAALASESWNEANTTLEPEDQSAGNSASHSERGAELATMEIPSNDFGRLCDVVRRSICGQTRETRKDKILHPRNDMTCSCANGVGVAAAGQQEGPFARGTKAHDLAEERRTEIVRMNGATRTAVHAIYRHRSHASDETGQMEMNRKTPMESIAPTSGGLISTSAMRELLERRADAHGLAQMSVQERRAERSKVNRATRSPTLTLRRGQRHAAGYWKTVLVDSIAVRTSSDLDVVEAGQEEAQTNRKLSRALGEIGPQQWVRALARINRANRMTALAIKRQQRKAPATEMVEQSAAKCPSQAGAFGGIGSQQLVRDLASIMRAKRMTLRAIKRQQRKTPVKEMAEESAAKGSSQISHQHNRRYAAVAAAKTRWGNAGISDVTAGTSGVLMGN